MEEEVGYTPLEEEKDNTVHTWHKEEVKYPLRAAATNASGALDRSTVGKGEDRSPLLSPSAASVLITE